MTEWWIKTGVSRKTLSRQYASSVEYFNVLTGRAWTSN